MKILKELVSSKGWFVLTGSGVSVDSGIPTYRNNDGKWMRSKPVEITDFLDSCEARKRFWLRNMLGWKFMSKAIPNNNHQYLSTLQKKGQLNCIVTQNVDGLHQKAGSSNVVDLHGRIDTVTCVTCDLKFSREYIQNLLIEKNPKFAEITGKILPDGDAKIDNVNYQSFNILDCPSCGGILKPDTVFFGESVPKKIVDRTFKLLDTSPGVLVIGSSLTTYSGYKYCRYAKENKKRVLIINKGPTRADDIADMKVSEDCAVVLSGWLAEIN
ncbi:MAG: NAD-dependent protein deacetylase [Pseudomonadota bacterium]|nr:NAD-dependent protein deacetylase [Pseudomonadota bacterium]